MDPQPARKLLAGIFKQSPLAVAFTLVSLAAFGVMAVFGVLTAPMLLRDILHDLPGPVDSPLTQFFQSATGDFIVWIGRGMLPLSLLVIWLTRK